NRLSKRKKLRIFKNLVSPINLKKSRNHNPREKITPQQTKA
ncbi:putative exported TonB protein, partial [Chlamydia psittaci 06-1683]